MRRILLLPLLLLIGAGLSWAETLSVTVSGHRRDPLSAHKVGSAHYIGAKQAARLYGAQVYWYPVSGRVQMSLRGKPLLFLVESKTARLNGQEVRLEAPVIVRGSQAMVPLSFFLSEEFASWSGFETSFNPRTRLVAVDHESSIGPLRWFSYKGYTRVVLELSQKLRYNVAPRGVGGLELSIPFGALEGPEEAKIADGIVDSVILKPGSKAAVLSVKTAGAQVRWKIQELERPRRVVIDFSSDGVQASAPNPPREASDYKPETSMEGLSTAASPTAAKGRRRIVIDAGHGGKDSGATGRRGVQEKDINLLAAQELAALLNEEGHFDVLMTRNDDTFIPLAERSRLANEFGADLFISVHCNASRSSGDTGYEVYFLSEKASDPEAERPAEFENSVLKLEDHAPQDGQASILLGELSKTENINAASELAALIARSLSRRVALFNRGVKQAAFYVLRGTHAPSILVEMAYLTHRQDERKLESRKFRRKIVDGVYAGLVEYSKRQGWFANSEGEAHGQAAAGRH
ncbi:MAG: N-acetylmuramoyl-L-alanine amidase [Elusimicrobia bacterium]|nr:N-acetylmuramoyl-L-alanine amidase [Elusimicrobiota bacterium]